MLKDFKEFALKGDMVDLALGLVVGSSFANIVTSLVKGIILPRVRMMAAGANPTQLPSIDYDSFLASLISFLMISVVVFAVVQVINRMKKGAEPEPVTKECPYCFYSIPLQASRCGHCTSQLEPASSPA